MATESKAEITDRIFRDCLFQKDEIVDGKPMTEPLVPDTWIMNRVGFNRERVEKHEVEILKLLDNFSPEFYSDGGGGMSFLNLCVTADGDQWGEHQTMEQLCQLGSAVGAVSFLLPREVWPALPGGMPYLVINRRDGKVVRS